ncbi:hypothetical protein D9M68_667190 [compost metagenome]
MKLNNVDHKRNGLFRILLFINLFAIAIWIVGQNINVYRYAVIGAIFEMLWLPIMISIILIPFIALYFWYKDKFIATSKFLYFLVWVILSGAILFILTRI